MAGYSPRPLVQKLGIKAGARVLFAHAPEQFVSGLGKLPNDVKLLKPGANQFDFALLFLRQGRELTRLAALSQRVKPSGMIWVAWPKKSAKTDTDLSFDVVQRAGLDLGLVDVKICAIDDFWSGLKFVVPLKDRKKKS